jgi:hypothetical protein
MKLVLLEIGAYALVFFAWFFFRRFLHRNITGDILVGAFIGTFTEFISEPLCNYHLTLTFYKDIPLVVPLAWGMMYAMAVYVSEKLYSFATGLHVIKPGDKRIFLFDVLGGVLVGFPLETAGTWLKVWEYNSNVVNWNLGLVPLLGMPWETLIAYGLLMLTGPTVVRYWQGSFEGRL